MNLSEERNYQKLMEVLDALELSAENRRLAEEYLTAREPEQTALLEKAVHQDFSKTDKGKLRQSIDYINQCKKRGRTQEADRFVRFVAAVGGATAYYPLAGYEWQLQSISEYVSAAQLTAMRAEGLAWDIHSLFGWRLVKLFDTGKQEPEVLREAMDLCWQEHDNSKILLACIYLHYRKPEQKKSSGLKGLLSGKAKKESPELPNIVNFLEKCFLGVLPAVFTQPKIGDHEMGQIEDFVKNSSPGQPVPPYLVKALERGQSSPYLTAFVSSCAFLAVDHSTIFENVLRVIALRSPEGVMNACRNISMERHGGAWASKTEERMEQLLCIRPDLCVRLYLQWKDTEGLRRMAGTYPELVREQAEHTSESEDYLFLMEQIKWGNPGFYHRMGLSRVSGEFAERIAQELTSDMESGKEAAREYLLGEGSLKAVYPYVNSWRGSSYSYSSRYQQLNSLRGNDEKMFRRSLVVEALRMHTSYFSCYFLTQSRRNENQEAYQKLREKEVDSLIQIFEEEGLPIQYQADAIGGIYDSYYQEADKNSLLDAAEKSIARRACGRRDEILTALGSGTAMGRCLCIRVLDHFWQEERDVILSCATDSSKQVKEQLVTVCAGHREWEPELKERLFSKKAQERELAVRVLKSWGADSYREEFLKVFETEKSRKLKELLKECLGARAQEGGTGEEGKSSAQIASGLLKGGKKRKVAWAYETPFSVVHFKSGEEAKEDYMQALLVAYADLSVPGVSPEAGALASELEEGELSRYMSELFDKWLEAGAEAKKKWVLYAASIHGGEEIVPVFWHQIQEWPQNARGAMAAEAVKALALNGSAQALLLVDQISRKFKFRQVKTAAGQALEYAASALGISREQLEDRIVPNLGFDEEFKHTFDYGTRTFQVYLTPSLELQVYDSEGKQLKNLPAPGKRDEEEKAKAAYAEYKRLKKQLKTVAANQKLRLEQALTGVRLWRADAWRELFVKNPVMHQFAIGLIWGLYEEGALVCTFRYMEDGSFTTEDEEEFELKEDVFVGLVHATELAKESLDAWKEQLEDYEIVQPIEQLTRPIYRITEEEKGQRELARFGGKLLNGLSLSGKLQGMGWYRGSVEDAGIYNTFYREDGGIGVELEFSGSYVGDENDEVTVYGAVFYKAGTVKRGSYVYDTVREENRYLLGEVNPRYFSEIVLQLARATASSREQFEYPACRQ